MPNNVLVGQANYWQPNYSVSADDSGSMSGSATYISDVGVCPVEFDGPFPFEGFPTLRLTSYQISNYGSLLYKISCSFKADALTTEDEEEGDEGSGSGSDSDNGESEEGTAGEEWNNDDKEKEESIDCTWTITGGIDVKPLSQHPKYKGFNAEDISAGYALLADGKIDAQAFFEHGTCVPINPNDMSFDPTKYTGCQALLSDANAEDYIDRIIKGNTLFFAPVYNVSISNVGSQAKTGASGLNELMAATGVSFEVTSTNTTTQNGVSNTTTNLSQTENE